MYSVFNQAIGIWESQQVLSRYLCNTQNHCCRWEFPGTEGSALPPGRAPASKAYGGSQEQGLPSPPILWLNIWEMNIYCPHNIMALKRQKVKL